MALLKKDNNVVSDKLKVSHSLTSGDTIRETHSKAETIWYRHVFQNKMRSSRVNTDHSL